MEFQLVLEKIKIPSPKEADIDMNDIDESLTFFRYYL